MSDCGQLGAWEIETPGVNIDLPGLVLVPGEIREVRTSFVIKVGHPQETEA